MHHQNSVFHALTKYIPWNEFDRLVDEYKADYRVRHLRTKSQLLSLVFAQMSGASSLREIEAGLASHQSQMYHLGMSVPARSTLADANAKRSWKVFADLYAVMVARANRKVRRGVADVVRIIDATNIKLSGLSSQWIRFENRGHSAKAHIVYDPDLGIALKADVTPRITSDLKPAKALTLEPGATYVFDLGYYDYGWWSEMDKLGCRFVSRLKTPTKLSQTRKRTIPQGATNILLDQIGLLPRRMKKSRKNPMWDPVREIVVAISSGKTIRVVTNDLDSPAQEIADLYKQRWQVELFFKWVKQNLDIKHFLGTSHNAVCIQVFTALIAHLIIKLAAEAQTCVRSLKNLTNLISINLMARRPITALNRPYIPKLPDAEQLKLELSIPETLNG